jgi:hypothetical protein
MWFDARAVAAEIAGGEQPPATHPDIGKRELPPATTATTATNYPRTPDFVAEVASVAGVSLQKPETGQAGRNPYFCGACREWETLGDPCAHIREILSWGLPT